ncbi:MAG: hypothetical protein MUF51_03375, partial [Vicinamibacteria bacterium]|nr:hypothetical protein [Vicinamibacteria bacterium]
ARLLTQVRELGADVIMLDLGAGHSENVIDLFGLAEKSLLLVKPEPTAVMSVYQFIKAAAFRRMAALTLGEASRQMIHESLEEHPDDLPRPLDLIRTIELSDAETARRLRDDLHAMQPYLVVNEARADQDLILGQQMALACERHIGVGARCAGTIRHDDAVWHGIRQGRLFMADPNSPASEDVRLLARKLLKNGETGSQKA